MRPTHVDAHHRSPSISLQCACFRNLRMKTKYLPLALVLCLTLLAPVVQAAPSVSLYVSPTGSDDNPGTSADRPFQTVEKARDTIRLAKYNQNMQADFIVYLRGGRYELAETLHFDARDSGSNGHSVIYQAFEKEEPVLCGGKRVTGWKSVEGEPYFVANVPAQTAVGKEGFASYFAQLYVNGVRAERARSNDLLTSSRQTWWSDPMYPVPAPAVAAPKPTVSSPTTNSKKSASKPAPKPAESWDGVYIKKSDLKHYTHPEDIRIFWLEVFKSIEMPLEAIIPCPDNPDEMILKFKHPEFQKVGEWLDTTKRVDQFFIVNALEELDEPGEWYLDQKTRKVYYYPMKRDGDLNQAEVYAPRIDFLVKLDGTQSNRVNHIRFDGITFQHGNWTEPKDRRLGWSQAEIDRDYTSEVPGQIVLNYADDITLTRCIVRHMGSCGIQLENGCSNVLIEGNVTYDTTGAGIEVGPYYLNEKDVPSDSVCTNTMIRNNVVRDTGRDYWQATGISIFGVYQCKVYHNDVSDTAYSAIHARIGSSGVVNSHIGKLEFKHNRVSNGFAGEKWGIADGGHLYMHGRYPNSEVSENYSLNANRDVMNDYYSDNFSHTVRWLNNISRGGCPRRPYYAWSPGNIGVIFDGNYSDTPSKGTGHATQTDFHLITDDQWPPEAQRIMDNAGLETPFRYLLNKIYGPDNLAWGKVCTSSSDVDTKHGAAQATDNNWDSYWQANVQAANSAWWAADLGQAYVIQKLAIMPRLDKYEPQARRMLEIQASNDPSFKDHIVLAERAELPWYNKKEKAASNLWEQFINVPHGYRYLRVQSTDPRNVLSMAEFFAYGYAVDTP
jgi:F5/8 type C domain/Right handed beta helix region